MCGSASVAVLAAGAGGGNECVTNHFQLRDVLADWPSLVGGVAQLYGPPPLRQNPTAEFERKFLLNRGPAHMGVCMGEQNLLNWLNVILYAAALNGDLDMLHRKYLDRPYELLPTL